MHSEQILYLSKNIYTIDGERPTTSANIPATRAPDLSIQQNAAEVPVDTSQERPPALEAGPSLANPDPAHEMAEAQESPTREAAPTTSSASSEQSSPLKKRLRSNARGKKNRFD